MVASASRTLWRGTTEPWEIAIIEGPSSITNPRALVGGPLGRSSATQDNTFQRIIDRVSCSQLRSGKEMVIGATPKPLAELSRGEIIEGIVARVGFESALATPNYQSHFIPCGTNSGIATHFGHGACYQFSMFCVAYGESASVKKRITEVVDEYLADKINQPSYAVPLFDGGNGELLAYTGSVITSVYRMVNGNIGQMHSVPFSLD